MDKKNNQIAHRRIVAGREILRKYGQNNNSPATPNESAGSGPLYLARVRNRLIVAIALLWPIFPIVFFLRRRHVSTVIICFLITPLVLVGMMIVVRPTWFERWRQWSNRELERMGEGLERRPPTGLP
jgi:hypothetical protein